MSKPRRQTRAAWLWIPVVAVLAAAFAIFRSFSGGTPTAATGEFAYVSRVVDGDTLKLSTGERVRLIGIDTPEVHESAKLDRDVRRSGRDRETIIALGRKSSAFTRGLCEGKTVRLAFDVKKRDRYGRILAYVYLEDGTFVNAKIIEEGYGTVMTVPPNVEHTALFAGLQTKAREEARGLWAEY